MTDEPLDRAHVEVAVAARHCPRRRLVVLCGIPPRGASGALVAAWARPWADCRTGPGPVLGRGPAALHKRPPPPEPWEVYAHAMRSGGAGSWHGSPGARAPTPSGRMKGGR